MIVLGGKDGNNKAPGSTGQFNPAATSLGHKVVVFGGRDDDNKNLSCGRVLILTHIIHAYD